MKSQTDRDVERIAAGLCRGCGQVEPVGALSLGEMPLANAYPTSGELGTPERRYPLDLGFCTACSLAQLTVSVPPEELFSTYRYFSSYSDTVLANAEEIAGRMIEALDLDRRSLAMEVASNDGYLLQRYARGGVPVLGIEPAVNVAEAAEARGIPTLRRFFGAELAEELRASGRRADVLHANNVLAHVPDVNGFVRGISRVLADDGVAVIETPYVRDLVERVEFDTIYHEHLFYFSLSSLDVLLRRNGLMVVAVERIPIHGGSLRVFARLASTVEPSAAVRELLAAEEEAGIARLEYFRDFGARVQALCSRIGVMLTRLRARGRRIGAYGAAAKGTVLLNAVGIGTETVEFVADRSPHKQGRVMPGVHIPIVHPDRLVRTMPDYVLLLAWNLVDEVLEQQAEYRRLGGRFIVPLPEPHIV